jgi:hypothetical protein
MSVSIKLSNTKHANKIVSKILILPRLYKLIVQKTTSLKYKIMKIF